jgi:hypothetical protein
VRRHPRRPAVLSVPAPGSLQAQPTTIPDPGAVSPPRPPMHSRRHAHVRADRTGWAAPRVGIVSPRRHLPGHVARCLREAPVGTLNPPARVRLRESGQRIANLFAILLETCRFQRFPFDVSVNGREHPRMWR